MASTSVHRIVLPSIHEMFPEYLLPSRTMALAPSATVAFRGRVVSPQNIQPPFSFDVLKSDPRGASLQHIATSRSRPPAPNIGATRNRRSSSSSSSSSDGDPEMESLEGENDNDAESEESTAYEGRKHPCPTCGKRFNRPSSLRIHVNTHTGATPFRCPHPSCGRAFNVMSNMRRHYRNHNIGNGGGLRSTYACPTSPSSTSSRSPSPLSPQSAPGTPVSGGWGASPTAAKVYRYSESDVRSERQ